MDAAVILGLELNWCRLFTAFVKRLLEPKRCVAGKLVGKVVYFVKNFNIKQVCLSVIEPNAFFIVYRCTVQSNSSVTIVWRRLEPNPGSLPSTAIVLEGGRVLRFNSFRSADAGTYQCIGTNRFGSDSDSAKLIVAPSKLKIR